MKKIIAFVLCSLLLTAMVVPAVSAEYSHETEIFDDGSYIVFSYEKPASVGTPEDEFQGSEEAELSGLTKIIRWLRNIFAAIFAKQTTVTKYKYCNYFDSEGKLLWTVCLKGTFTYNHRKAVCVDSEITCEISDSDWRLISSDHSQENNSAKGSFAIRQYKLGVPLKLVEKELTLTCDKDGNVK